MEFELLSIVVQEFQFVELIKQFDKVINDEQNYSQKTIKTFLILKLQEELFLY